MTLGILKLNFRLLIDAKSNSPFEQLQRLNPPDGALTDFREELPRILLRQFEYEDSSVRAGLHLMHSDFFKVLVALACDLEMDKSNGIVDDHKWYSFYTFLPFTDCLCN